MKKFSLTLILITYLVSQNFADIIKNSDKEGWYFSTFMGLSKSMDNKIAFNFDDRDDEVFTAKYNNRSFEDSFWWFFRFENWKNKKSRGMELIHHKIYLDNTNDVVENFSISDGYNLLYYTMGKQRNKSSYRLGLGVVLAHSDVTIQGREQYKRKGFVGHKLAGPSLMLNYERWIWENNYYFISFDSKLTFSYAVAPISTSRSEYVVAPDIALHVSLGLGSKPEILKLKGIKKAAYFLPLAYPKVVGATVIGTSFLPEDYNL